MAFLYRDLSLFEFDEDGMKELMTRASELLEAVGTGLVLAGVTSGDYQETCTATLTDGSAEPHHLVFERDLSGLKFDTVGKLRAVREEFLNYYNSYCASD